jgi:hypothetical protein
MRQCGTCQACCQAIGVHELDKPAGARCPNQCERGCAIYESRPESCRTFQCLWHEGNFGAEHRPDKLGIVFATMWNPRIRRELITAYETRPGAFEEPEAEKLILRLRRHQVVVMFPLEGPPRLTGRREAVRALDAELTRADQRIS